MNIDFKFKASAKWREAYTFKIQLFHSVNGPQNESNPIKLLRPFLYLPRRVWLIYIKSRVHELLVPCRKNRKSLEKFHQNFLLENTKIICDKTMTWSRFIQNLGFGRSNWWREKERDKKNLSPGALLICCVLIAFFVQFIIIINTIFYINIRWDPLGHSPNGITLKK